MLNVGPIHPQLLVPPPLPSSRVRKPEVMLLCFTPGCGELAGTSSGGERSGLGQHEQVGASASCLSWKREDDCVLLTAHTAPEIRSTGWGGCCSEAMAEGGLTPCPQPSKHVHRESHSPGSPGVLVLPSRGAPSSGAGAGCSQLLCRRPGARTPISLQLCWCRPCVSSRGFGRSWDTLKVHCAINTRAQGCQHTPGWGGCVC